MKPSSIHDWQLIGPALCRALAGSHSCREVMASLSLHCLEDSTTLTFLTLTFFLPHLLQSPTLGDGGINALFSAEHSIFSYSQHREQLWSLQLLQSEVLSLKLTIFVSLEKCLPHL